LANVRQSFWAGAIVWRELFWHMRCPWQRSADGASGVFIGRFLVQYGNPKSKASVQALAAISCWAPQCFDWRIFGSIWRFQGQSLVAGSIFLAGNILAHALSMAAIS
jgi:hypothetical protein